MLRTAGSRARYERACRSLAGGVSSSLRRNARPYPLYFDSGSGPRVTDVDGNDYIDYGLAWGPLILGHSPDELTAAIAAQARRGLTFGAQHDLEFEVSERLTEIIPCADRVTFANSGTEAVQVALRLARAITQRPRFLKFEGHYHGWDDSVLVSFHPTKAQLESAGAGSRSGRRRSACARRHLVVEWNDRDAVEHVFRESLGADLRRDLRADAVQQRVYRTRAWLPGIPERHHTRHGSLLIFDEVITGFRLHLSGAQGYYGVVPDLATYAKALGGGIALSAVTGRAEYMDRIARWNGRPCRHAQWQSDCARLREGDARRAEPPGSLFRADAPRGAAPCGARGTFARRGCEVVTSGAGAVFHVSFMESRARRYRDLLAADAALYSDFALALLSEGILVLPDGRWYLSAAHTTM